MQELQRLDEEFDLADAALAELEVDAGRSGGVLFRARLEPAHLVDRLEVEVFAEDERREPAQSFLTSLEIARDRPRFQQGEALPGRTLRFVVELETADGVDDRTAA